MSPNATLNRSRAAARPASTQQRARRPWGRILLAVLIVLVLGTAGWLVTVSSVFAARQVSVTGAQVLSVAEVRAAAAVPLGTPLARQDVQAIASRVAALRPVRSVEVHRAWPRTISIQVRERTPVLGVRQPDGFALVDDQGAGYLTVPKLPDKVVPAHVDLSNIPLLQQVGSVAAALPDPLRNRVEQIQATSRDRIELALTDGDTVIWGSADESALKAQVLTALLKHKARTYDVSAPHNPALRQ